MAINALVVDDQAEHCAIWADLARQQGFEVMDAPGVSEAVDLLAGYSFSAALIDLHLSPDEDPNDPNSVLASIALIEKIRQLNPQCQIIALTTVASDEQGAKAMLAGASAFANGSWKAIQLERYIQKRLQLARMLVERSEKATV